MIAIIDYRMGNISSVRNAFDYLGYQADITRDIDLINKADHLVLPGVGSYRKAMQNIRGLEMFDIIVSRVKDGCPILGICLGMQLMTKGSTEGAIDGITEGFGFLPYEVAKFTEDEMHPIPHIGFNEVKIGDAGEEMFSSIEDNSDFYFVHSYRILSKDEEYVAGRTDYDGCFVSAYAKDNIWGTQFHPEKSQSNGLKLLENFARL